MEILNDTPFSFGCIAGRLPFPGHSLTLIVKATFDLVPDGEVTPADEQLYATGDEFYEDDEEMTGGPRYASDFAYYKPRADLLLAGHCYAPKGMVAAARQVSFGVGNTLKSLMVSGDRHWLGPVATDPVPFSKFPLRYAYTYGGMGFNQNPSGRGYTKKADGEGGSKRYLPNITHPGEQMATPLSRLEPAGFGPIHREWHPRKPKLGSYRGNYLKSRWPWFAEDFDWHYFNASPEVLQADYLRGDEELFFKNLHADHLNYHSRLPGLKIRCFVRRTVSSHSDEAPFSEVSMNLDTCWTDMDDEKVVLVWRGWCQVLTEDVEDVQHVFIVSETLVQPPQSIAHYESLLRKRIEDAGENWEETPPPEMPAHEIEGDTDTLIAEAEASCRKSMLDAGMDPDNPPKPSVEDKEKEKRIFEELGVDQWGEVAPEWTREKVVIQYDATKDLSGLNLQHLDLSGIDFSGGTLSRTLLSHTNLSGAFLNNTDLTETVLENACLAGVNLEEAVLDNADLTAADLSGANLCHAQMADAIFDHARMTGVQIDHADAMGASFMDADLTAASFAESTLTGADFSNSNLSGVNFSGANLAEATVEGVQAPGIVMDGAYLTELRASEKSIFTGGSFKQVSARESIWEAADLSDTDFSFSNMEGASFSKATLVNARFCAADMKYARFDKANLENADLTLGNFLESSFERTDLTGCDCRQANMYGSEFLNAIIENTGFEGTNLKMTKLAKR